MRRKLIVLCMLIFVLVAAKTTSKAAEMLQATNFKSGVSLPWQVLESNEENSYSKITDGNLMVHIDKAGTNKWDVQLCHREISLVAGHTYKIHFKLHAKNTQLIYVKVGDKGDPYWEAWNNNWTNYTVGPSGINVTETFTASKSSALAEFAFHFGGELARSMPNEIYFEEMSLQDDEFSPTPVPTVTPPRDIRINQLGYYPYAVKKATIVSNSTSPLYVELKDSTGKVVWTGRSLPKSGRDIASKEFVHIIDFSAFKTVGKSYQLVSGSATSFPFDIDEDLYSQMKWDSLRYFYYARSGVEIRMPYCIDPQWARPAGHPKDIATLYPGKKYSDGEYTGGPSSINGTGGWYDAGDFGKYVVQGGLATWTLQNEYERALRNGKDHTFKDGSMNIPESENGYPDLLDEARYNVEYFLKVQIPAGNNKAGMVISKLADEFWLTLGVWPDQDKQRRFFYPPSTAATLNFAAVVAQAGRLWKDYDVAFSGKCIAAAETAWQAAKKYPEVYAPYGQETAGCGGYTENPTFDEFYWAACELYITTGKSEYLDYIKSSKYAFKCPTTLTGESNGTPGSIDWANTAACGTIDMVLCAPSGLDSADLQSARNSMAAAADNYVAVQQKEGYGVPLEVSTYINEFGGQKEEIKDGYPWASNSFMVNQSMIMAYAYDFTNNIKYLNGVTETMDYIMGRNPLIKCYVSGYGENPLKYPHHRFFCPQISPSFPSVPPGFLAGGPNSGCQDPWASAAGLKANQAAAQKCYIDNVESWSTNEVANDRNAMLAWLTGYLDSVQPTICTIPPPSPTPTEDEIASCDLNGDGAINMADVMLIAGAFNSKAGDERFVAKYDIYKDSAINIADVMIIAKYFNKKVTEL